MFLVAFYGFFCIGELATKSVDCAASGIQFREVKFLIGDGTANMVKIVITQFKHIPSRQPFEILIERDDTLPFCPLKALVDYCRIRGSQLDQLFCHQNIAPVTVNQFNSELSRCLKFCGLDPSRYKGHSFRIGAVSHGG